MEKSQSRKTVKFLLLFVFIILCWVAGRQYDIRLDEIQQKFQGYPLAASGLLFVGTYVVLTTLIWFGPKDILRTAAGVLFGATISTVFVVIGEIINSVVMFHTSRFFGRELVENRLGGRKANLDKVAHSRSLLGVFTVRINLLIPIRFTDLGYGLTNISFGKYILPATLALVPRVFWQQYFLAHGGA
ncbi:MAG: VTT domain-containing protein, partial [Candidatus Omnitrophica bacterium]|nr:VTT domain-containing protein [Candidatus Omnitrophota bacterium]